MSLETAGLRAGLDVPWSDGVVLGAGARRPSVNTASTPGGFKTRSRRMPTIQGKLRKRTIRQAAIATCVGVPTGTVPVQAIAHCRAVR